MRRADRLLQIIQLFRRWRGPVTASRLAEELEVTVRTVYRDIAALMANGVPIRGEAGVGYVLGDGYDLPPLMFSTDELEALMLGARLVASSGDPGLISSANDAIAKIAAVIPADMRPVLLDAPLYAPDFDQTVADMVDIADIRLAIRAHQKIEIHYSDASGIETRRTVWPVAVAYHKGVRLVVAWCELRNAFRLFRVDRIRRLDATDMPIPERRKILFHRWRQEAIAEHGDYLNSNGLELL